MPTVFEFLEEFSARLRGAGIRFAITSGMACVRYGLQQNTKDSDWIIEPGHLDRLRGLLGALEDRMPPWRVRYRPVFGAPLEREWFDGGWTSHLAVSHDPSRPANHLDWFGRPPRVTDWEADAEGFATRQVVAGMKKTNRLRDWPIVDALAWQMRERHPADALIHLRSASMLQRLWDSVDEETRELARTQRPLLRFVEVGGNAEALEPLLLREREAWMAINEGRYRVFRDSWKEFHRRWRREADWDWPTEEPFLDQHRRLVGAAREHGLESAPLGGGRADEVYENGLALAARRLDTSLENLKMVAPEKGQALP